MQTTATVSDFIITKWQSTSILLWLPTADSTLVLEDQENQYWGWS